MLGRPTLQGAKNLKSRYSYLTKEGMISGQGVMPACDNAPEGSKMMQIPLQITLKDMPQSDAVESRIREKADKLSRFHDKIISCRVVVESPQRHRHQGKLYSVHIDLSVPGAELVANRAQDEDVYVAIRDAFDAIIRQLEDFSRRQRGDVKSHSAPGV